MYVYTYICLCVTNKDSPIEPGVWSEVRLGLEQSRIAGNSDATDGDEVGAHVVDDEPMTSPLQVLLELIPRAR